MNIIPLQDVSFDDEATLAMGAAFDQACKSLPSSGRNGAARELIAKRIIAAAKHGERDPAELCGRVLRTLSADEISARVTGVGRESPLPAYASIARVA